MRNILELGKCDYNNSGKKNCLATVEWEIEKGRFSMSGNIWNPRHTDIYTGGQCLETLLEYFPNHKVLQRMVEVWREWHLNGMQAGSPAQTKAIEEYKKANPQWCYDYSEACAILEKMWLNPDPDFLYKTPGAEGDPQPYKYGSAWLKRELPVGIEMEIRGWPTTRPDRINPETQKFEPNKDAFTVWLEARYNFEARFIEEGERGDYYACTFTEKKPSEGKKVKTMKADFYQGIGHRINNLGKPWNEREARANYSTRFQVNHRKSAPDIKKVMDCLIRDAQAYDNARDVADFVSEFGYEDFKEGRRIWQACEKQYNDLQQFTGGDFYALMNNDELPEEKRA